MYLLQTHLADVRRSFSLSIINAYITNAAARTRIVCYNTEHMHVSTSGFEGPLDTLLQLIHAQKLEISSIALAAVADQYFSIVQEKQEHPTTLAPFLVVAAQLLLIKTRALLPQSAQDDIQEAAHDMTERLQRLEAVQRAAYLLQQQLEHAQRPFLIRIPRVKTRFAPGGVSLNDLYHHATLACTRNERLANALAQERLQRRTTVEEKLVQLRAYVQQHHHTSCMQLLAGEHTKDKANVTFLSLLELVKRGDIRIQHTDRTTNDIYASRIETRPSHQSVTSATSSNEQHIRIV